jgi:mono/diheme cytochrome c family protein
MSSTTRDFRPLLVGGALLQLALASPAFAAEATSGTDEFFEKRVRPVLVQHCYQCHSAAAKKSKGGLRLDTREGLLKGGGSGPALLPGDPDQSLFIRAVRRTDKHLRMPPKEKLSDAQIADLAAWVKAGAPAPRAAVPSGLSPKDGHHLWSLRPVKDPPVPRVKGTSWVRTPVDAFILARLEAAGVVPAPHADPRTLLRRVTFDLTGLPPTPAEMDAFLADLSPEALERVVDRLLASPRYGERWGRHWLDVVRYADTCGNASDHPVPQAHKYRDWVIRAFRRDLPYDQFVREQIAGDLMPAGSDAERRDCITATGYLAVARRFGGDRTGEHYLTLDDTIDNLGRAVLGMTLACARCHDHKFDPFTVRDYYGLYGIFASTRYPFPGAEVGKQQEDFVPLASPAEVEATLRPYREKLARLAARVKQLEAAEAEARKSPEGAAKETGVRAAAEAVAAAQKELAATRADRPAIEDAYAVAEGTPADAPVQVRGDPKRLGDRVPRGFPAVLGGQRLPPGFRGSGRSQLAGWLTDPRNPLTARVMVNRIWQHHFGRGIVETPNDFGRRGKPPTHPELLDFLAARFIESGWSVKAMHRLILLSRSWQLVSTAPASAVAADPNNALFGRSARRRLDAEAIRDAMLFVAGELDERPGGGHPFPPARTWGFTQHVPFMAVYETRRRSVYLMQPRLRKHPYLALFDGADPSSSTADRLPSTTPLQALFLMNDSLAHEVAAKLAKRMIASAPDVAARLTLAYRLSLGRPPTANERRACAGFLRAYRDRLTALKMPSDQLERLTWAAFARALLCTNEFVYID